MYIKYKRKKYNLYIEIDAKLNLITGNSSTGKTSFATEMNKYSNLVETDFDFIEVNPSLSIIKSLCKNLHEDLIAFIIDTDEYVTSEVVDYISSIYNPNAYFIILGRKYTKRLPIAIWNIFYLEVCNGVTVNKRFIKEAEFYKFHRFAKVLTEDSKSGYNFFKNIFESTEPIRSNSLVIQSLDIDSLVVFDGVGFGSYLEQFIEVVSKNPTYSYLCWNSFEYFILETIFKEVEIPNVINTEDAITKKLNELKQGGYSKSIGCTGNACSMCKALCKQSSLKCLRGSKYNQIIDYYDSVNPLENLLKDLTNMSTKRT